MVKLFAFSILLCGISAVFAAFGSLQTRRHARSRDQCNRFVEGPLAFCSAAGYNDTFEFPEGLTERELQYAAVGFKRLFQSMTNCSQNTLAVTMGCSYAVPQCSKGKRVYPCKRVCNEFLKQCEKGIPEVFLDYLIASCHVLPNEKASSGKCHEPPNFTTNDSVKGPLDRGCVELIIPACKNLGVSNYTLISLEQQKRLYKYTYRKEYKVGNVETIFPPLFQKLFQRYPKCQENLKKLYCGEYLPPCFPHEPAAEGPGFYTICQSVCDEITRDCPDFFRNYFPDAEYCSFAGKENTSHGYCRRREWPPPFAWARYVRVSEPSTPSSSTKGPKSKGAKAWIIALAVVVPLLIVGLILGGAIWWKWRRVPSQSGYTKQADDTAPLEGAMEA